MRPLLTLPFLIAALAFAPPAPAQNFCAPRDSLAPIAITWPDDALEEPVWTLEFLPPSSSTGTDHSGLEIRNVRFHDRLVMKQGHVPILNVKYDPGGCGCFRDWSYDDVRFRADNPVGTCYAEATPGTVETVCDVGGSGGDIGSFLGVAAERYEDRLALTTQYSAGWYRYTMTWEFHRDGTIRPLFGFGTLASPCTGNPRRHHAYWRFDFDIGGAEHDYVVETSAVAGEVVFAEETLRTWQAPADGIAWSVLDTETGLGYRVEPSAADYDTPVDPGTGFPEVDDFAREDAVVARYRPGETDDGGRQGEVGCAAEFESGSPMIVNGDAVYDADVVLWYRSGATKQDLQIDACEVVGRVLTGFGEWGAPVAAEEGVAPTRFTLDDPFPNPFDGSTTIRFSVETAQRVTLTLYDAAGRNVRSLYAGTPATGAVQSVVVQGADLPSGVYTVRLEGPGFVGSKRIVLLR